MKEYIERAAAMESILGLTIVDPAVAQYANAVCYHLQNLPAADVAPVRHGRWKLVGADKRGRGGNWVGILIQTKYLLISVPHILIFAMPETAIWIAH